MNNEGIVDSCGIPRHGKHICTQAQEYHSKSYGERYVA